LVGLTVRAQDTNANLDLTTQKIHSSKKAVMFSAVLPGLGQVYNGKYWKLPILYGTAGTLFFFYQYNLYQYNRYFSAYEAELDGFDHEFSDPIYRDRYGSGLASELLEFSDYYYRNLERTVIGMFGLYFLNVIDAMIDAHFFYFDISDDLSFHWTPDMYVGPLGDQRMGLSLSLNF
jgi:hypothetical protein